MTQSCLCVICWGVVLLPFLEQRTSAEAPSGEDAWKEGELRVQRTTLQVPSVFLCRGRRCGAMLLSLVPQTPGFCPALMLGDLCGLCVLWCARFVVCHRRLDFEMSMQAQAH